MIAQGRPDKRDRVKRDRGGAGTLCFVGREAETRRLRQAILDRKSLIICGAPGVGKTTLISKVIEELPGGLAARCICLPGMKDLKDVLQRLIRALYESGDRGLRHELHAQGVSAVTFDAWLKGNSSSRLRGTLYRAVESGECRIFLDHLPSVTRAVERVIKELFWMRKTPVYLVPHGLTEEAVARLMHVFYWGEGERLVLGPLPMPAARRLLESCVASFGLSGLELRDFRDEVLTLSGRVPGAIVGMCSLAADARYQCGSSIKTKLVHIDYLMSGQNSAITQPCAATDSHERTSD